MLVIDGTTSIYVFNRTTRSENELFEGYSDELLTFASAACIVFIIIGVPGNLLTIIALSRSKQNRNATAIFIINLALSDLLFGCFNLPLAASTFLKRAWTHGDLLCRLFPLLRYGLLAVSLFTVSLITINRYIMIAHPRKYTRIYRRGYLALMVAGTWLSALLIMIPTWHGIWGTFGLDTSIGSCSILYDRYGRSPKEFLFLIAFMVPCICIVICYARIFCTVRKAASRTREKSASSPTTVMPTKKLSTQIIPTETPKTVDPLAITSAKPFNIDADDIVFIDVDDANEFLSSVPVVPAAVNNMVAHKHNNFPLIDRRVIPELDVLNDEVKRTPSTEKISSMSPIKASIKTSFNKITSRKNHYVSIGNTSNASSIYPGRMSQKDRRLLKMILVIFVSFVICYLPITVAKIWHSSTEVHLFNISGYLLIYLTTCINPLIYVLMSLEYRQAYRNLLLCRMEKRKDDYNNRAK